MGIPVFADLHLNTLTRDAYRWDVVYSIPELCKLHKATHVVILGDLTEAKDRHAAALVNKLVEAMVMIAERAQLIILKGNHDYVDADVPFYKFLHMMPGITFITEPTLMELPKVGACWFLPHTNQAEKQWPKLLKDVPPWDDEPDLIFCHQTFAGAVGDNGRELGGIPTSLLPKVPVLSGDVHKPQIIRGASHIKYVGAPYTVDFGDDYAPRYMVLREGGKQQPVLLSGPQKRLVEWPGEKGGPRWDRAQPGDILKIRVSLKRSQMAKWPEMRDHVRKIAQDEGFIVWAVEPVLIDGAKEGEVERRIVTRSDADLMKAYTKSARTDERTAAIGLKIMGAV